MYSIDPSLRRNYLGEILPLSADADTYYVSALGDTVALTNPSAVNTIIAYSAEYILPANVQNLVVQYASDAVGVGNGLDDILIADGAYNYTLVAGTGNDVMIGNGSGGQFDTGAGSTTFVIAKGDGDDVISNFRTSADVVRLNGFTGLAGFASVQAAMTQVGSDVVLNLGSGQTLTFRNVTVSSFTANDFMLPAYLPGMTLRFDDEFNIFVSSPYGTQGWMTQGGSVWRTLSSNGELEYYSDSSVGVNPFSDSNGVLNITAAPGTNPLGLPYNSGIITTEGSYNFEYGSRRGQCKAARRGRHVAGDLAGAKQLQLAARNRHHGGLGQQSNDPVRKHAQWPHQRILDQVDLCRRHEPRVPHLRPGLGTELDHLVTSTARPSPPRRPRPT